MRSRIPLLALAALILACNSGGSSSLPGTTRIGSNAGLSAQVEVLYDGVGAPHVYARSDADAAYAFGYLQARDRLFQMDFFRRFARGRLAEVLGGALVPTDAQQRTFFTSTQHTASGSYRIEDVMAEEARSRSDLAGSLTSGQRYADGVNRFLQDLRAGANGARLPLEYALLGVGPADVAVWTIEDSLAIGRLETWLLSTTLDEEIAYGAMAPVLTGAGRADLLADITRFAPAAPSFILPPASAAAAGGALLPLPPAMGSAELAAMALAALPRPFGRERAGSNNWVVAPSRTASGHALLANDPHLTLMNPPIFYLAHLVTPARDVAGVAFPGAPVIVIGHNDRLAWGATVVGYDVTDVYVEAAPGGVVAGAVPVVEQIAVKGGVPVTYTIPLVPQHGPVVSVDAADGTALSMKWTGQVPTWEVQAFVELNAARSVDEAFEALSKFEVGAQNFVLADVDGHIGYDPHARVPIRPAGCIPWAPMPGDGSCEWQGDVPDAELPQAKDPPSGFIATANNDQGGFTADGNPLAGGHYFYATNDLGFRHQRIVERLTEKPGGYALDDMTSIQADNVSNFARALVPAVNSLLAAVPGDVAARGLTDAAALLQGWGDAASGASDPGPYSTPTGLDGTDPASPDSADPDVAWRSAAAMLFHAFAPRFARRVLDDDLAPFSLSVNSLAGSLNDQFVAKYLVALGETVLNQLDPGQPGPPVPLATGTTLCAPPVAPAPPCAAEAVAALADAVGWLRGPAIFGPGSDPLDWRWGRWHRVRFTSPLHTGELPITLYDLGPYANDGGLHTVDVANFGWSDDGSSPDTPASDLFLQRSGPNVRFAAELEPGHVRWRAVIPGGEVDYKPDPHYQDQVQAWLGNQAGDQPYLRSEVEAASKARLVFDP